MDDFPKLVNNQAENSLRERERGEMGMRASRVFPTFRIPPSFVGAKGRDRLHRCKLDARFLSTRTNGRRASKSALFIPRLESTTVSRFSRRKIVDIRSRNGQFREYRDYALSRWVRAWFRVGRSGGGGERKREQKPFFPANGKLSFANCVISYRDKLENARREKSVRCVRLVLGACTRNASRMRPSICASDPRFLGVSSHIPTYVSR